MSDFKSNLFNSIGLLQIIYVQQDLLKELFFIFKIDQLKNNDFEPNRRIRNELVGHPIRKFKNELLSSSRYANNITNKTVCYIKYSRDDNFKGNIIEYDVDKILTNHFALLNKSFDLIIDKQKNILKDFENELGNLKAIINSNIQFYKLLNLIEQRYYYIFENDYFTSIDLQNCFEKLNIHLRYNFAINYFMEKLNNSIDENIIEINKIINTPNLEISEQEEDITPDAVLNINFLSTGELNNCADLKTSDNFRYYISKIADKKIWCIDLLKDLFLDNSSIQEELDFMSKNSEISFEYNSSFLYCKSLMEQYRIKNVKKT